MSCSFNMEAWDKLLIHRRSDTLHAFRRKKSQRNNRLLQNQIQNSTQGREPLRETQRLAAYRNSLRQMRTYLQVRNLPRCNNYLLVMSPEPRTLQPAPRQNPRHPPCRDCRRLLVSHALAPRRHTSRRHHGYVDFNGTSKALNRHRLPLRHRPLRWRRARPQRAAHNSRVRPSRTRRPPATGTDQMMRCATTSAAPTWLKSFM